MAFGFKKSIVSGAAIALAVGLIAGCTSEAPNASTSQGSTGQGDVVTIGLTYIPNVQFSPLYVAAEDDIFEQHNLSVELRHHGTDEGLFTALTTGKEDVVIAGGDEVLQARAQGMDLVSIGTYYNKYPVTVIVPEGSDVHTFADLKGKKIGVPGEYGSSWLALLAALDQAGMTTSDVSVVSIGYTAQASLVSGKVDAVVGFSNNDLVQLQANDVPVRSVALSEAGVPLASVSVITTQEWLDADKERAAAVAKSIEQGIASVVANQDNALDATEVYDPTLADEAARAGARLTLDATTDLFVNPAGETSMKQDLELWGNMNTFLTSVPGIISGNTRIDGAVTNEFVGQ